MTDKMKSGGFTNQEYVQSIQNGQKIMGHFSTGVALFERKDGSRYQKTIKLLNVKPGPGGLETPELKESIREL